MGVVSHADGGGGALSAGAGGFLICGSVAALLLSPCNGEGLPLMPGRAVPFGRPKGTKNHQGASPLVPPCIKKLCVKPWGLPPNPHILSFTEVPLFAGRLCANRTKPNQARLLPFWLCCSVPFLYCFAAISAVGAGLTRPPLSMKLARFPLPHLFRVQTPICRARRSRRAAGFPPGYRCLLPAEAPPSYQANVVFAETTRIWTGFDRYRILLHKETQKLTGS